jgi:hypothetical protein
VLGGNARASLIQAISRGDKTAFSKRWRAGIVALVARDHSMGYCSNYRAVDDEFRRLVSCDKTKPRRKTEALARSPASRSTAGHGSASGVRCDGSSAPAKVRDNQNCPIA